MDDQRAGKVIRALRRRRGWRQDDLARAAGCSQNLISLVERGHLDKVALRTIRRVLAAVDASVSLDLRWRGAGIDRLIDEDHSALVGAVAHRLRTLGWVVEIEVTYSVYGERGSYDLLAWHPTSAVLLVVEVKTEVASVEATVRKLDEKTRLARQISMERFGWKALQVGRALIVAESSTQRARVARHAAVFDAAFPTRNVALLRWLRNPNGGLSGLWFFSERDGRVGKLSSGAGQRVRLQHPSKRNPPIAV